MSIKILPNREAAILVDTPDYFNYKDKGLAIKYILESTGDHLKGNNMLVLFGTWGSGKSTLMRYIRSELDKGKLYKTVYFTGWEHEKDNNLALSLVDAIIEDLDETAVVKEFVTMASDFLINLSKGITIKIPGFEFSPKDSLEGDEKSDQKKKNDLSHYKKIKAFQDKYSELEGSVLKKDEKLIVFIDDLDRCEPENVLNLLSAIKLFFSLGKRTIFFFGVDKEAVSNAVETKYKNVIKADEYLEKVFDISFEMPRNPPIEELIQHYFPQHSYAISSFFKQINFTTARHLKKVLNKYEILKELKNNILSVELRELIPNLKPSPNVNPIESVLTLLIIILYEFYPDTFNELEEYEEKIMAYARKNNINDPKNGYQQLTDPNHGCCYKSLNKKNLTQIIFEAVDHTERNGGTPNAPNNIRYNGYTRFLSLFTPKEVVSFNSNTGDMEDADFIKFFETKGDQLLLNFCKYLIVYKSSVLELNSTYIYTNLFQMAKMLL